MESKQGEALAGLLNQANSNGFVWQEHCSPPFSDARIGVLARLESGVRTERLCPFDPDRIRQHWKVNQPGCWTCLESSGCQRWHGLRLIRLPPLLESKPARGGDRPEPGSCHDVAFRSSRMLSAKFGQPAGRWPVSKTAPGKVRVLGGPPDSSGVGCRYPGRSLKPCTRTFDSFRLSQIHTSRGLPASPLGFEPKARRFDSCLVFHLTSIATQ